MLYCSVLHCTVSYPNSEDEFFKGRASALFILYLWPYTQASLNKCVLDEWINEWMLYAYITHTLIRQDKQDSNESQVYLHTDISPTLQSAYPPDNDTSLFISYVEHILFISFKTRVSLKKRKITQEPN